MAMTVNVGGAWKDVPDGAEVNVGGVWKAIAGIEVNIAGVWKTVWTAASSILNLGTMNIDSYDEYPPASGGWRFARAGQTYLYYGGSSWTAYPNNYWWSLLVDRYSNMGDDYEVKMEKTSGNLTCSRADDTYFTINGDIDFEWTNTEEASAGTYYGQCTIRKITDTADFLTVNVIVLIEIE